ncbi:MAG: hypothetical protein SGPRY_013097, partial [Prymnesium sp.]
MLRPLVLPLPQSNSVFLRMLPVPFLRWLSLLTLPSPLGLQAERSAKEEIGDFVAERSGLSKRQTPEWQRSDTTREASSAAMSDKRERTSCSGTEETSNGCADQCQAAGDYLARLRLCECDLSPGGVFYDALNCLVNLATARCSQASPAVARHGLWLLLQLRYASDALAKRFEDRQHSSLCQKRDRAEATAGILTGVAAMAGSILAAICTHTANLSVMYRAELQLKAALLGGKVLPDAERRLRHSASEPAMHRGSARRAGQFSSAEYFPIAAPGMSDAKKRYIDWMYQVITSDPAKANGFTWKRMLRSIPRGARELIHELHVPTSLTQS